MKKINYSVFPPQCVLLLQSWWITNRHTAVWHEIGLQWPVPPYFAQPTAEFARLFLKIVVTVQWLYATCCVFNFMATDTSGSRTVPSEYYYSMGRYWISRTFERLFLQRLFWQVMRTVWGSARCFCDFTMSWGLKTSYQWCVACRGQRTLEGMHRRAIALSFDHIWRSGCGTSCHIYFMPILGKYAPLSAKGCMISHY